MASISEQIDSIVSRLHRFAGQWVESRGPRGGIIATNRETGRVLRGLWATQALQRQSQSPAKPETSQKATPKKATAPSVKAFAKMPATTVSLQPGQKRVAENIWDKLSEKNMIASEHNPAGITSTELAVIVKKTSDEGARNELHVTKIMSNIDKAVRDFQAKKEASVLAKPGYYDSEFRGNLSNESDRRAAGLIHKALFERRSAGVYSPKHRGTVGVTPDEIADLVKFGRSKGKSFGEILQAAVNFGEKKMNEKYPDVSREKEEESDDDGERVDDGGNDEGKEPVTRKRR